MSDESLFREVDEELRRDQMEKLWKRYGNILVAVAAGVILSVGGMKAWQYWQKQQAETAGVAYYEAVKLIEDGKAKEADAALGKLVNGSHDGYATLARLQRAGVLAANGKREEAVKAYDVIAADSGVEQSLRDLARVRAAYLLADHASAADLATRLKGLDAASSSWRSAAREILAIAHYREGSYLKADNLLNELIADTDAPAAARQRATVFVSLLQPLLAGKKAEN